MGELNVACVYAYMVITTLCLILITIFTVMNWNKMGCNKMEFSNFTNSSNNPIHGYTYSDIDVDWAETGCLAKTLSPSEKKYIFTIGNNPRFNSITARNNAKKELNRIKTRSTCTSRNIPENELIELSNMWKSTNCSAPFPIVHVQNMYKNSPNRTFENRKNDFRRYIQIMNDNFAGNDVNPHLGESLETSFKKCYGDNWRGNKEVFEQYNFLQTLT